MVPVWFTLSLEASQTSLGFAQVRGITPLLVEALPWLDELQDFLASGFPSSKKKLDLGSKRSNFQSYGLN